MAALPLPLLESIVTSVAFAVVLASALGYAWRIYRQPYLGHWAGFWALYVVVWSVYVTAYGDADPGHPLAQAFAIGAATFASYAARALLALGIASFLGWRRPSRRAVLGAAAVLVALTAAVVGLRALSLAGAVPAAVLLPLRPYFLGLFLELALAVVLLRRSQAGPALGARSILAVALVAGATSDLWDLSLELRGVWGLLAASETLTRLAAISAHVCDGLFATGMMVAALGTEHARAERASAELRTRDLQLQEAQRLESVGQLAGGLAHDFNNLLTAILTSLDFVRDALPAGSRAVEDVDAAAAAGRRAAKLTRQLLTIARRQPVVPRLVDVGACVAALRPVLAPLLGERVRLEGRFSSAIWPVRIDPAQLEQLVLNLVLNARDAMPDGGAVVIEAANVTFAAGPRLPEEREVPPGDWVRLSVEDEGEGMDAATRARAFEPFFTTKPAGRGSGLGLATVHGIVRQADGYITIRSAPGAGTRICVFLRRAAGVPERATPVPPTSVRGTETVLLVDDDALVRAAAARALEARGFRVIAAEDGPEALRILGTRPDGVAALVTDVVMPGMDGIALAAAARERQRDLPVLLVSGYAPPGLDAPDPLPGGGPSARLAKPFTPDALAAEVRALLDGARARTG